MQGLIELIRIFYWNFDNSLLQTKLTTYEIKLMSGERVLLRDYYHANYATFCSFASRYLSDKYEIEDVVQESFIAFWEQNKEFANLASVKSYFYTTIRNSCLDKLKHDKVKNKFLELRKRIADSKEFFLENLLKQEVYSYVHEQIEKLSQMEKKVILMAMEGASNNEIAEKLGIKLNTVKTHKQRAYKLLRENITKFIFFILSK